MKKQALFFISMFLLCNATFAQKAELTIPIGHTDPVNTLAYTADEQIVASASSGIVKVWDINNGRLLKTIETKANQMNLLVTIPKFQGFGYIADNKFFIVEAPTFQPRLFVTIPYGFAPRDICASGDGKFVFLAGSNFDNNLRCPFIYKVDLTLGTWSIFNKIPPFDTNPNNNDTEEFKYLKLLPDGQRFMATCWSSPKRQNKIDPLYLFSIATGAVEKPNPLLNDMIFLDKTKGLALYSKPIDASKGIYETTAKEVSLSDFSEKKSFILTNSPSHFYWGGRPQFLYDSERNTYTFTSYNEGYNVLQLDLTTGKIVKKAFDDNAKKPNFQSAVAMPKTKKIICGGSSTVMVFDGLTLNKDIVLGENTPFPGTYIRYNPVQDALLLKSMGSVRFLEMGGASGLIKVHSLDMNDLYGRINWSPDGTKVGFYSGLKDTFGILESKNLGALPRKAKSPMHLSTDPDNLVWTPDSKTFTFGPMFQRGEVNATTMSYNTRYIGATGYQGKNIYTKNGKYIIVNEYRYSGTNTYIGSEDNYLICYDAVSGMRVWESPLTTKTGLVPITTIDNDQTLVALSGQDGAFHYINMAKGQVTGTFQANNTGGLVLSQAISTDGSRCVGLANGQITIFDFVNKTSTPVIAQLAKGSLGACFIHNDKFVAIASGDNTIHIIDIAQKRDIAQIYLFGNSNEWVVTTPEGRFEASAGAQEFMYYMKNNEAIPLGSLFEKFYTPKLLHRLLEGEQFEPIPLDVNTLKTPPSIKIAIDNQHRNLVVEDDISSITVSKQQINLSVQADCPSDVVTEIRLFQNGKLVQTTRNLVVEDEQAGEKSMSKIFPITLDDGENNFRAVAYNSQRTESQPALLTVVFKMPKSSSVTPSVKPNASPDAESGIRLHLVVIGINKYKNPKHNLNYALSDATSFKEMFEKQNTGVFSKTIVSFITDEKATRENISAELEKVKADANSKDVLIFYYAGHGVMNDQKEFYLVPHDVTQLYGNDGALSQKGLSANLLQNYSKEIKAQKQLFILDACQSAGALEQVVAARGAAEEKAIAQLARATGTHWLTASGSEQFASEFAQLGHGAFTYVLLEALKGGADKGGDKRITVKELDAYLQEQVPEVTAKHKGTPQYPASYGYGNDFPIFILK